MSYDSENCPSLIKFVRRTPEEFLVILKTNFDSFRPLTEAANEREQSPATRHEQGDKNHLAVDQRDTGKSRRD
jgi:hypothetical protein